MMIKFTSINYAHSRLHATCRLHGCRRSYNRKVQVGPPNRAECFQLGLCSPFTGWRTNSTEYLSPLGLLNSSVTTLPEDPISFSTSSSAHAEFAHQHSLDFLYSSSSR